jgi:hypothetical protein
MYVHVGRNVVLKRIVWLGLTAVVFILFAWLVCSASMCQRLSWDLYLMLHRILCRELYFRKSIKFWFEILIEWSILYWTDGAKIKFFLQFLMQIYYIPLNIFGIEIHADKTSVLLVYFMYLMHRTYNKFNWPCFVLFSRSLSILGLLFSLNANFGRNLFTGLRRKSPIIRPIG